MKIIHSSLLKIFTALAVTALAVTALILSFTFQAKTDQQRGAPASVQPVQKSEDDLRSMAITQVQPEYPPLALAARVSGSVLVEITIDEKGKVISARVLSGHALLKDAAQTAARRWEFNPAAVDGEPVRVLGTITFTFDPDNYVADPNRKKLPEEQPALTPEEKEKLTRAEDAADRFIERWHETLDLNVLFDEMYVSSHEARSRNIRFFYAVYKFISFTGYDPGVRKDVDEALMRDGFMAFWNMWFLIGQYRLAFEKDEFAESKAPPEIEKGLKELRRVRLNKKYIIRAEVKEYINKANYVSSLYRKCLTHDVFNSDLHKANLKRCKESSGEPSSSFRVTKGFAAYGIGEDVEVYNLRRCLFDFYFVEEAGQLKVLTLGFEL